LPGVSSTQVVNLLAERLEALTNTRGTTRTGPELQIAYLRWAATTSNMLRFAISPADVEWLVPPQSSWHLASITPAEWNRPVIADLVGVETDARIDLFTTARGELESQIKRWNGSIPGRLIVPDSSLFIEHPQKIRDMVIADDLSERHTPLRLVVPIIVIDELDGLKRSGDEHTRWRLGHTLGVLDELLANGEGPARLRDADFSGMDEGKIPRGEVTVEILFDPPDHRRLSINDDEIIDRALAVHRVAGRPVTLITYDSGQSTRAKAHGLSVRKLTKPLGAESNRSGNSRKREAQLRGERRRAEGSVASSAERAAGV
jgi:hypothetical protein